MTATALRGRHSTEPQSPTWATKPMNQTAEPCPYHPDVLAIARQLGITRPRALAHLQRLYDETAARADADFDFGAYVLAYADPTGETATARALRAQVKRRH